MKVTFFFTPTKVGFNFLILDMCFGTEYEAQDKPFDIV